MRITFGTGTRKVHSCGIGLERTKEGFAVQDLPVARNVDKRPNGRRTRRSAVTSAEASTETLITESELNAKLGYF